MTTTTISAAPAATPTEQSASRTRSLSGSPVGLVINLAIGFAAYGLLSVLVSLPGLAPSLAYDQLIAGITASVPKQLAWFLMDFTEPEFYASVFAGAGTIIGGAISWQLARRVLREPASRGRAPHGGKRGLHGRYHELCLHCLGGPAVFLNVLQRIGTVRVRPR